MPEIPEIQAHAERLEEQFAGHRLREFQLLKFTALKTATPPPSEAFGYPLLAVGRRGKYILLEFATVRFAIHLMQGGRLLPDTKKSAKPRGGQARFGFEDGPALLLTEAGTERRAGVWVMPADDTIDPPPLDVLGPEAGSINATELAELFATKNRRIHGFLRDQRSIAGLGRRLANEICHRAKISPFAMTGKMGVSGAEIIAEAIEASIADGLRHERERSNMSASKERPSRVHRRAREECPECGDIVRAVEYSGYTVNYCARCQTGGKALADNTTSRFLK